MPKPKPGNTQSSRKQSSSKPKLGSQTETLTATFFEKNGHTVLARNWRSGRLGELDLVVWDPDSKTLIFVEVKARSNEEKGPAIAAITPQKQAQLLMLAEQFLANSQDPLPPFQTLRFDVVTWDYRGQTQRWQMQHWPDAFQS
ncbi:MAG: YraN family protein [Cyanobacteria bacterium]|nr:YraN family protein [Cyanobacteriota bacterium]